MTKVYELPNGHRMVADIDESTRVCNITETTLDSLVSKLNYYSEQTDVLDKIRTEIEQEYNRLSVVRADETLELGECLGLKMSLKIINKYTAESENQ